jgi:hypothetical protein
MRLFLMLCLLPSLIYSQTIVRGSYEFKGNRMGVFSDSAISIIVNKDGLARGTYISKQVTLWGTWFNRYSNTSTDNFAGNYTYVDTGAGVYVAAMQVTDTTGARSAIETSKVMGSNKIDIEVDNGQGNECALILHPDIMTYGSYAYSGTYNLSLDRALGVYEFGLIDLGTSIRIDSASNTATIRNGFLQQTVWDSVTVYNYTPLQGLSVYCSDCTPKDNSSGGVIVTGNGSLWKRNW